MNFNELVYMYEFDGNLKKYSSLFFNNDFVEEMTGYIESAEDGYDFSKALTLARDFAICSNLTEEEHKAYIALLNKNSFFSRIARFLYHDRQDWKSNVIYTLGKFTVPENSIFLEEAYVKSYYRNNPVLAARSLREIRWLGSPDFKRLSDMLIEKKDLINCFSLGLFLSSGTDGDYKVLLEHYPDLKPGLSTRDEVDLYFRRYENLVSHVQHANDLKDWSREEYLMSIDFYMKNRTELFNKNKIDFMKVYKQMFNPAEARKIRRGM